MRYQYCSVCCWKSGSGLVFTCGSSRLSAPFCYSSSKLFHNTCYFLHTIVPVEPILGLSQSPSLIGCMSDIYIAFLFNLYDTSRNNVNTYLYVVSLSIITLIDVIIGSHWTSACSVVMKIATFVESSREVHIAAGRAYRNSRTEIWSSMLRFLTCFKLEKICNTANF